MMLNASARGGVLAGAGHRSLCWLLLLLMLFLGSPSVSANALHSLRFDHLSIEQGVPSTGVQSLYQSRQGFVWLGTSNGLVRYDGRHMKTFGSEPGNPESLSHSRVLSLYEDENEQLWVGTRRGLDKLDLHSYRVTRMVMPAALRPHEKQVYALAPAGKGRLWVASAGGLFLFDMARAQFTDWAKANQGLATLNGEVHALISDGRGGFWFGQGTSVVHIDQNGILLTHLSTLDDHGIIGFNLADYMVRSLAIDGGGRLWVGMSGGLRIWTLEHDKPMPASEKEQLQIPHATVTAILRDQDQAMWLALGDERGLYRWNRATAALENFVHLPSVKASLSGDSLTSLMQDNNGSLWVGTSDYGVNLVDLNGRGFSAYLKIPGDEHSLSHELVTAVMPDDAQHVWVGTRGGGLNRVNLRNGDTQRISREVVSVGHIMALLAAPDGRLWVAGEGLQLYDPQTNRSREISLGNTTEAGGSIYALARDGKGNIWAGSAAGLYRIGPDLHVQVFRAAPSKKGALNDDMVFSLMVDHAQRLWVGSNGALHVWNELQQNFTRIGVASAEVPNPEKLSVTSIRQDSQGRIWLATQVGLLQLQAQGASWQFKSYRKMLGAMSNLPEAMQISKDGDIWLSSERGLMRVRTETGETHFYSAMSYFDGAFNFGAAARAADGSLLFGGVGLIRFDPALLRDNPIPPRVILSDLLIFNRSLLEHTRRRADSNPEHEQVDRRNEISLSSIGISGALSEASSITLSHQQSMVSFELSALQFYHRNRNRYAWKLDGYDENWIYGQADQGIATYTNLNPGRYRLLAMVANPDGVWSGSTSLLEIEILPPFWRTWWWYLCWAILLLVILGVIYRQRARTNQATRLHLEEQVRHRTQDVVEQKILAEQQREIAEKARHDINTLSEIGRQITSSLDPGAIQQALYLYVKELVNASTFGIGLVDWDSGTLAFDFVMQNDKLAMPYKRSLSAIEQPAVQCVLNAEELKIDELTHDSRLFDQHMIKTTGQSRAIMQDGSEPELSRSGIYVPMILKGKVSGVLAVLSDQPGAFGQHGLDILRTLSAYAAIALDNAEAYRRLQLTQTRLVEQEKLAALGSLVAGVAHELNTPIGNSVLMASTMYDMSQQFLKLVQSGELRRSDLETFCANSTSSADLIVRNLDSAANLISSFKQIAVDQTSDNRRSFDLKTVCDEVALTLSNRLKRESHELRIDVAEGLQMDSFPGSFGQVLSNLIINAIVHGLAGRSQGLISLEGRAIEGDQVQLIFRDNGRGIDAAHIDRIFEPFFTTRLGQGGSGLGLHVSYNIICSVLGGSISVQRSDGAGACFIIILPRHAPQNERAPNVLFSE
jgi:ligand-binding sensor domain-containing protein/signal transduction histidine kinase